jgi:hypothetical protein
MILGPRTAICPVTERDPFGNRFGLVDSLPFDVKAVR